MDNKKNILLAVIAGAVAGGVLGILFAPAKGSETREKIANDRKKMADVLKEKFNEKKEGLCNGACRNKKNEKETEKVVA